MANHTLTLVGVDSCLIIDSTSTLVNVYKNHSVTLTEAQFVDLKTNHTDIFALFALGGPEYEVKSAITSLKIANYTAAQNEFVLCDATAGAFAVTLPTTPPSGTFVTVKKLDTTTNAVTVACGGTDLVITGAASTAASVAFTINETRTFVFDGISRWVISNGQTPLSNILQVGNALSEVNATTARSNLSVAQRLASTAIKTGNYTAVAGDLVLCNATSAGFAVTLPTTPAIGTRVNIQKLDITTNAITITCGGSDLFLLGPSTTSASVSLALDAGAEVVYDGTSRWIIVSDYTPLSTSDARYSLIGAPEFPAYGSGVWYGLPNNRTLINSSFSAAVGTATAIAFWVPSTKTLTDCGVDIVSAGDAGSLARMAFYSMNTANGRPGSLITGGDVGTVVADVGSTFQKKSSLSVVFAKGFYYAVVALQNFVTTAPRPRVVAGSTAAAVGGSPGFNFTDMGSSDPTSTPSNVFNGYSMTGVTAAFPNNFTVATSMTNFSNALCAIAVFGKFA